MIDTTNISRAELVSLVDMMDKFNNDLTINETSLKDQVHRMRQLLLEGTRLLTYMDIDKADRHMEWMKEVMKELELK
jgi:hypothetical protein